MLAHDFLLQNKGLEADDQGPLVFCRNLGQMEVKVGKMLELSTLPRPGLELSANKPSHPIPGRLSGGPSKKVSL